MKIDLATVSLVLGILVGILGILNQLNNLRKAQEEQVKAQAIRDTKLDDKLEQIDQRLTEHNNYASMFADVKESIIEMRNDIKWIKESRK